jgi:hypothetical protein
MPRNARIAQSFSPAQLRGLPSGLRMPVRIHVQLEPSLGRNRELYGRLHGFGHRSLQFGIGQLEGGQASREAGSSPDTLSSGKSKCIRYSVGWVGRELARTDSARNLVRQDRRAGRTGRGRSRSGWRMRCTMANMSSSARLNRTDRPSTGDGLGALVQEPGVCMPACVLGTLF